MAKKQTMNLFEAHIEKVFLILAIGFLGWVVLTRFVSPPALSTDDGQSFRKISKIAETGATKAQDILATMKRPDNRPLPAIKQSAGQFGIIETTKPTFVPLSPFGPIIEGVKPAEKRLYSVPLIPPLTTPKIILTHARALKPDTIDALSPEMQFDIHQNMIDAIVELVEHPRGGARSLQQPHALHDEIVIVERGAGGLAPFIFADDFIAKRQQRSGR